MKTIRKLFALMLTLSLVTGIALTPALAEETVDLTTLYKNKDVTSTWEDSEAIHLTLNGTSVSADDTSGIAVDGDTLTIRAEGTYVLTGTWNGQIVIDVADDVKVRLILSGVTVTSAVGPALYETSADKLILTLVEGTVNTFTDTAALSISTEEGEDEVAAAIWAEDDLSINGTGTLVVNGNVKHGLLSRADLIIAEGTYVISARSDAIRGRNSVLILGGQITITTEGDGIVSTRTTKEGKGWVLIAGGTIQITAGGGAGEVTTAINNGWSRGWDDWGGSNGSSSSSDTASAKGIKAATDITVMGGSITIDSLDDALHAVNVYVSGGALSIAAGDDGIHADEVLTVSGGSVDITQSYEGLEGQYITLSGGSISLISSDDGLNATASKSSNAAATTGWGMDAVEDALITLSGATVYVNAGGDGLDSNGNVIMTSGTVVVSGPTSSADGALDYNGTFALSGGTLVASGANGMMQNVSSAENQAALLVYLSGTASAGAEVVVTDASGNIVLSYTPDKQFQVVLVSSSELQVGQRYTVTVGGTTVYSDTLTQSVSSNGSTGRGGQQGWGGSGGGRGR